MACRTNCGSASTFTDAICLRGVQALDVCGSGIPAEEGGEGCFTVRLRTQDTNTVYLNQYGDGFSALTAKVRVGAGGSQLLQEVTDIGLYVPDLVSADKAVTIESPTPNTVGSRSISLNVATASDNGLEVLNDTDAPSFTDTNGLYVRKWAHEMVEFVGGPSTSQPLSTAPVDYALTAGGTAVKIASVDDLVATYTNNNGVEMLVRFDVFWGGTQIHAKDTPQFVYVNHTASMNFGMASDVASNSGYGMPGNAFSGTDTYILTFPRTASSYVTTVMPGGTAQLSAFNTVTATGAPPLTSSTTDDAGARDPNAWSVVWGNPRIIVTAISKMAEEG